MDLNHLLIWTVGAACGSMLLNVIGQPDPLRKAAIPSLLLGILALGLALFPEWVGWICAGLLLLGLLPIWLTRLTQLLLVKRNYTLARWTGTAVSCLRPTQETRGLPRLIRAMEALQNGNVDRVASLLNTIPESSALAPMARILRTRATGAWQDFLDWTSAADHRNLVWNDLQTYELYLQSLAELGQRRQMLQAYSQPQFQRPPFSGAVGNIVRMKAAAFCGEESAVAELLGGPLRELPLDVKRFWRVTALQAAGQTDAAATEFESLIQHSDASVALAARRRLEHPVLSRTALPLDEFELQVCQSLVKEISLAAQREPLQLKSSRSSRATWLLAALLVLVFLLEIPGGSENFANLERMGALLIPPLPGESQGWRIVAAAFLHFGPLHLAMNLLGLLILGRLLEGLWGSARLLVTYLVAAIGSIGLTPFLMRPVAPLERTILVGASGGVMGLIGGLLIQALINLIRGRSLLAFQEFASLLLVVVIQLAFDANTPNVSSEAHLLGMTIGILCGGMWNLLGIGGVRVRRGARAR